jgi:hypothetical protein
MLKLGGGSWPPRTLFDPLWPSPLLPFASVLHSLSPLFVTRSPSLSDVENRKKIKKFRKWMEKRLEEEVGDLEV